MLIGKDFDKIEWGFMGFDLLEPNAFIGDTILAVLAFYFAFKIRKIGFGYSFFNNWFWFFILFGIGLFIGGLGHLLWNYWGLQGKYFSWYSGILAVYYIEQAMISLFPDKKIGLTLINISIGKLFLAVIGLTVLIFSVDLSDDVSKGLVIPSINSAIGMVVALLVLPIVYKKEIPHNGLRYYMLAFFVMLPTALFQFMKINFAQWFDRNDASHVLMVISFIFYYLGIRAVSRYFN